MGCTLGFWATVVEAVLGVLSWISGWGSDDRPRKPPPSGKDWLILLAVVVGTVLFFVWLVWHGQQQDA